MLPVVSYRRSLPRLAALFFLVFLGFRAAAYLDPALQMQLGNPSNATADTNNHNHYLLVRSVEAMDYSDNLREPNWASWDLTSSDVGNSGRSEAFAVDPNLPSNFYQVKSNDYSGSGYDRGHLCPSADRTVSLETNELVFYMSNMMPQASDNNSGIWANFESYCRSLLSTGEVLIICGPRGFTGARTTSPGQIAIPTYTWKVAVVVPLGAGMATNRITTSTRVIAIDVPNSNGVSSVWQNYVTTAGQVERDTGLKFFTALPGTLASALRSKLDGTNFPAPQITGFNPTYGAETTNVVITGTNFTSARIVAFNGVPAVFSLDSNTQITAVVPTNATSGLISVTTPSGTANSANSFTIVNTNTVDLSVSSTHTGNFTQGDTNAAYTLSVLNIGSGSSSGTVTVSNTLPAGLTATAISGAGWTVDLPNLTCTRSDILGAGSTYPAITITVAVVSNAPASVTNMVIVTGGGDTNLNNNASLDPTTVIAAGIPTVSTGSATNIGAASAVLAGTVNANNQAAGTGFEFGFTTNYGAFVSAGNVTGNAVNAASAMASGLLPSTTYHYRIAATNILGGSVGNDQTFTTDVNSNVVTLAGWDTKGTSAWGPSPFAASTNAPNVFNSGLIRGIGVGTNNTGAAGGWGGNNWTNTSAVAAIGSNQVFTFTMGGTNGYKVSYSAISRFDYRRSATGPANGLLQYQIGNGTFQDIASLAYPASTNAGSSLGNIDLSGVPALQNVGPGTNVTFRVVNWGGTSSAGTWYVFDTSNSLAPDFVIDGVVALANPPVADLVATLTHSGVFTQADIGDVCTIIVSNAGPVATAGSVNVTNLLPSGLVATSMDGSGWAMDLATASCTRVDPLLSGATYPPIQVTVNVATNAAATLTNIVQVLGGGQTNLANDFATDVISVVPLTPSELWRLQYFGDKANAGAGADTAIVTPDGMANLYKYALGLDPLVATNDPAVGDITTGYLRITAPRNPEATDVSIQAQSAADLQGGAWSSNSIIVDQDSSTIFRAHDTNAVTTGTQEFMRLYVTRP